MSVLQPSEYDISYFDGNKTSLKHNAGYSSYERWYRNSNDFVPTEQSTGEYFKDLALKLKNDYILQGKKVLELGCAKGFIVEDLRSMGIDAYGIDISSYVIGEASEVVKSYLTIADVKTYLTTYKTKEFDLVFSRWFLECIDDIDLPNLVIQINRIAKLQVHIIREDSKSEFYNTKSIQTWLNSLSWQKGTILIPNGNMQQILKK